MVTALKIKKVHFWNKEVKKIYFESFIKKDRMNFGLMCFLSTLMPNSKFLAFYEKKSLVGFLYYGVSRKHIFLMFLGVNKEIRNKGYGSRILNYITNRYKKKCVVTTIGDPESTDISNCIIRERFYEKNGFTNTYYTIKMGGLNQSILTANKPFDKSKFARFILFYSCFFIIPVIRKSKEYNAIYKEEEK